jgi:uncharacterized protein YdeI (YjbR/CyaY-like superfamily)
MMPSAHQLPENAIHPLTIGQWRNWLENHHQRGTGVWLISFKKANGLPRFEYSEAVEQALCFGWVDSKPAKLDDQRSMLWFAPRKPTSAWSAINKARVERLIKARQMHPAGLAAVDQAKANGRWHALDGVEALETPPDLLLAFESYPAAKTLFDAFPRSAKRGILEWIMQAKTPPTRARRIEETARLAARNIRANQWSPKKAT